MSRAVVVQGHVLKQLACGGPVVPAEDVPALFVTLGRRTSQTLKLRQNVCLRTVAKRPCKLNAAL